MSSSCECGIPLGWELEGDCDRCGKKISAERIASLSGVPSTKLSINNEAQFGGSPVNVGINKTAPVDISEIGTAAAKRVKYYGTLFDKIGSILNVLNSIGAGVLLILLFFLDLQGLYVLLGILVIAVLWGFSYLQSSIIRGLASYFQMRSADYLERKAVNRDTNKERK
jgi:hypothetical protein